MFKLSEVERTHILTTLVECEGNRTRAAEVLGISVRCLRNKLHLYVDAGVKFPRPQQALRNPILISLSRP